MKELLTELDQLIDEISWSAARHKREWEEDRAKGMLDIAFELDALVKKYKKVT